MTAARDPRHSESVGIFDAREPGNLRRMAAADASRSLRRALQHVVLDEMHALDGAERIARQVGIGCAEQAAAEVAHVELTVDVAAMLLYVYLEHQATNAVLRLTCTVEPIELSPEGQERRLLQSIWVSAYELCCFGGMEDETDEPDVTTAVAASRAFRRLAIDLRTSGYAGAALACSLSAVNLALDSPAVVAAVDVAMGLLPSDADPENSLYPLCQRPVRRSPSRNQ